MSIKDSQHSSENAKVTPSYQSFPVYPHTILKKRKLLVTNSIIFSFYFKNDFKIYFKKNVNSKLCMGK